jgi:hypothetical protein
LKIRKAAKSTAKGSSVPATPRLVLNEFLRCYKKSFNTEGTEYHREMQRNSGSAFGWKTGGCILAREMVADGASACEGK